MDAPTLREFDAVRVTQINGPAESHLALTTSLRAPRIGDEGIIVGRQSGAPVITYIVEAVEPSGDTLWLALFTAEELSAVE
jgi:hypothetical protein